MDAHTHVILEVLNALQGSKLRYVLKGGTALMLCYGLDRISTDVDLDQQDGALDFFELMDTLCSFRGYTCNHGKDTTSVKRCHIHYGGTMPLKVEVLMRDADIPESMYHKDSRGFWVYNIRELARKKTVAYSGRDRIRDAYDVCYLVLNYYDSIDLPLVRDALVAKGVEQIDYLINTQHDDCIDARRLYDMFLAVWEKLNLKL